MTQGEKEQWLIDNYRKEDLFAQMADTLRDICPITYNDVINEMFNEAWTDAQAALDDTEMEVL